MQAEPPSERATLQESEPLPPADQQTEHSRPPTPGNQDDWDEDRSDPIVYNDAGEPLGYC